MKFKIEKNIRSYKDQYFVLYKKNFLTRWKYIRTRCGVVGHWETKKGAETYINQEKIRLGLKK